MDEIQDLETALRRLCVTQERLDKFMGMAAGLSILVEMADRLVRDITYEREESGGDPGVIRYYRIEKALEDYRYVKRTVKW